MNDEDIKIIKGLLRNSEYILLDEEALAIENLLKENKQLELDEKEKEVVEAYRNLKKITGSDSWIVCNPETMWSEYFVPVAKIKEKIKELEKERQKYREENTRIDEDYFFDINGFDNAILVLQALLEGK